MAEAIPKDQIIKPTVVTVSILDIVERLEPLRHQPTVEYQFANGRKFKSIVDYTD